MLRQSYHILSDLHLEQRQKINTLQQFVDTYKQIGRKGYNINDQLNKQRILILAGDIGYPTDKNYWTFLEDCSNRYKHVICVAGNHEYYNEYNNMDQIDDLIRTKSQELFDLNGNFHYLNNSTITIDGVKYIGSTLWSNLDSTRKKDITHGLNDFYSIQMNFCKRFTFDDYQKRHQRDLLWLQNELNQTVSTNTTNFVVITHHLPSEQLIHTKYKSHPINSAFFTNLDHVIKGKLWIAGHTHTPMTKIIGSTKVIVNPFGYASECLYGGIEECTIEFD